MLFVKCGCRIHADRLGTCKSLHLLQLPIDRDRRCRCNTEILTVCVNSLLIIPCAGEECLGISVCSYIAVREVRICDQIYQIIGHCHCLVSAEVKACIGVTAIRSEQCASVCHIESGDIPGVVQRESYLALLEHGIQRLNILIREDGLIIIHEPCIAGERESVNRTVIGHGIHCGLGTVGFHVLDIGAAELGETAGLEQIRNLVICKQIYICTDAGVRSDIRLRVAFRANAILESNGPFRMCFCKCLALRLEPLSVVIGLVFLRSPNRDGGTDRFLAPRAAGFTASRAASARAA